MAGPHRTTLRASVRYFHGGAPDLKPGDLIEPRTAGDTAHLRDDCPVCVARANGQQLETDDLDPTLVYVTTDRDYARIYAAGYGNGALYVVEPIGELTASPDPVESWGVPKARVVSVYDPLVRFTAKDVRRVMRKYA